MKNHLCNMMMAATLMCAAQVSAQTATDPGEGLRAAVGSTSGTTAISWWGKAGRTYFVQTCVTLMEADWRYVPVVESGTDEVITWSLSSNAERGFVRLVCTDQIYTGSAADADFDNDGLTNSQELAVNIKSDPFKEDSDFDGYSDSVEWFGGFSPTTPFSSPEFSNARLFWEVCSAYVYAHNHVTKTSNDPEGQERWLVAKTYNPGGSNDPPQIITGNKPAFPGLPPVPEFNALEFGVWNTNDFSGPLSTTERYTWSPNSEHEEREFTGTWRKLRMRANYPSLRTQVVHLLLEKLSQDSPTPSGPAEVIDRVVLAMRLPANATESAVQDLPLAVEQGKKLEVKASIPTVEVRRPSYYWKALAWGTGAKPDYFRKTDPNTADPLGVDTLATKSLAVATWTNLVVENTNVFSFQFHPENIKNDMDAFYIRVSGGAGASLRIHLSTDSEGTDHDDPGADVELTPVAGQAGVYQSPALCLVSNTGDDAKSCGATADGALNDPTFMIALGGKLQMQWVNNGVPDSVLSEIATVPPFKKLKVKAYILKKGTGGNAAHVTSTGAVEAQFKIAQERLAQVGVLLETSVEEVANNPAGVEFHNSNTFDQPSLPSGQAHYTLPDESRALFTLNAAGVVECYFLSDFANAATLAYAVVPRALAQADTAHAYQVVVNADTMAFDTVAHEILHILTDGIHGPPHNDFTTYDAGQVMSLWYAGPLNADSFYYRKRIYDQMYYNSYTCPLLKPIVP